MANTRQAGVKPLITLNRIREHQCDVPLIGFFDGRLDSEAALLLCFLFGQDMIFERLFALDFSGAGNLESLLGS